MINRRRFVQLLSGSVCGLGLVEQVLASAAADCPWHIESDGTTNGTKVFFNGKSKEPVTDIYAVSTAEPGVWLMDLSYIKVEKATIQDKVQIIANIALDVVVGERATITLHGKPLRMPHDRAVFHAAAVSGIVTVKYDIVATEQQEKHV